MTQPMSSTLGTFLTTSHLLMLSQTRYDNSLKYHVLCHLQLCAYMVPSDCSAPSPGSLPLVLLITQLELSPFPNCFPTFPPWGGNVLTVALGRLCFNFMLTYTYMSSPLDCEWLVVALVVKNPPANAGDVRDLGLIPGLGRPPGGGPGNPF